MRVELYGVASLGVSRKDVVDKFCESERGVGVVLVNLDAEAVGGVEDWCCFVIDLLAGAEEGETWGGEACGFDLDHGVVGLLEDEVVDLVAEFRWEGEEAGGFDCRLF